MTTDCCPWLGNNIFRKPNGGGPAEVGCIITVGDGENSLGEFNGPNAIRQALDSLGPDTFVAHILIGEGNYEVTGLSDNFNLDGLISVTLEACNPLSAIIMNTSGVVPTIEGTTDTAMAVRLFGLVMVCETGSGPGIDIAGVLTVEQCILVGHGILSHGGAGTGGFLQSLHVSSSALIGVNDSTANRGPLVTLSPGSNPPTTFAGVIEESLLVSSLENPVLLIEPEAALTTSIEISKVVHRDCMILLDSIDDETTFGNDFNPGVLKLDMNGNTTGSVTLRDITWENCNVFANLLGGPASVLLYLRAGDDDEHSMIVEHLTIRGGRWVATAGLGDVETTVAPFYIGPATYPGPPDYTNFDFEFETRLPVRKVTMEDVVVGFDDFLPGPTPPDPLNHGGAPAELNVTDSPSRWAAYTLIAARMAVRNVSCVRMAALSGSGDFQFITSEEAIIDGLSSTSYSDGDIDAPKYRIQLVALGPIGKIHARSIVLRGPDNGTQMVEDGWAGILLHAAAAADGQIRMTECDVAQLDNVDNVQHGFSIFGQDDTHAIQVAIDGCRSLFNSGHGFHYRHNGQTATSPDAPFVSPLTIESCIAGENTLSGISMTGATSPNPVPFFNFTLSGNNCFSNQEAGIVLAPAIWQISDANIVPSILGNHCIFNEKFQIAIGQDVAQGNPGEVALLCRNNDCSLNADLLRGVIKVVTPTGVALTTPAALTDMPQGLHTGLVAPAGGGNVQKSQETEGTLVENVGELETP